jgi:signal transduction histidine kinase
VRGIQQLATGVREDLGEGASVEVSENLDLLLERATRLENMITQLHAFARVNADQHALSEVIDVNNLIDVVEDQLGIPPGFEVIRDIAQPEIRHLRAPIELIIRNLVQNAIRHHHRGEGRVWVRTVAHTDGCTLCVEDDGPGIPEKHRERVFEPLETLRPRDDGAGSGLGLSLVRRTVKQLNGYLVLRESAHGGARFVIDLPVPTLDDSVSAE